MGARSGWALEATLAASAISSEGASRTFSRIGSGDLYGPAPRVSERKYGEPVRLRRLRTTHQMKLVVKPPSSRTTRTGRPCHNVEVPRLSVNVLIGPPAARP